jgi:hypothetical protein
LTFAPGDPITSAWGNTVPAFANSGDNGKKIQVGTSSAIIISGNNFVAGSSITFTTAFGSSPNVQATVDSTLGGTNGNYGVRVTTKSTTAVTFTVFRTDGSNAPGNQAVSFSWVAIG